MVWLVVPCLHLLIVTTYPGVPDGIGAIHYSYVEFLYYYY